MTEREFITNLKKIDIELTEKQLSEFKIYAEFLLEYNKNVNLTAIKNESEVYLKHFYDSLLLLKYFDLNDEKIIDIGCGAGFPGIPLKILCPNISLTLLDSNGKKTIFLEKLREKLKIDYEIINDRAENYVIDKREFYDFCISRAVASLRVLSELCIPFIKVNGKFIAYKSNVEKELEESKDTIEILGGQIETIKEDIIPVIDAKRCFVIIDKKYTTNEKYPRRYDKIIKKALQK